jgi:hypothetical protein
MLKRNKGVLLGLLLLGLIVSVGNPISTQAAGRGQPSDWKRFFYYPYLYYPQNFKRDQGSYDHMYYRYPQERRVPVYNKDWYNFYPTARPYHRGHHFILDVF